MLDESATGKFEEIARCIEPQSKLLRVWPLRGGISARMTALEIALPDGRARSLVVRQPGDWTLRQNPQAAATEFRILQMVRAIGVSAPLPVTLDGTGELLSTPYFVMEHIDGLPQYKPHDAVEFVSQLAVQLARIHRVKEGGYDLSFLPRQTARLAARIRNWPEKLDQSLDEERIRTTLTIAWPLSRLNEPVLVHGDFWPGNLLWRDGRLLAVVDWEDAELGDPLFDVAVCRLDLLMLFGQTAMDEFTRQYRLQTTVDFSNLPYWDLVAALRPASNLAAWAAGWPALGRPDITEATMRAAHRLFVTRAFASLPAKT